MYTAARGTGAFFDGVRLAPPSAPDGHARQWPGLLRTRYMPRSLSEAASTGFDQAGLHHVEVSAAGVAYPMAATGELSHALYWRTLPWDHAPGSLLAREAGMVVARLDGSTYRPFDGRFGLLTAVDDHVWSTVRSALPDVIDDAPV
jgi:fructose-1,6-bisphosphatase/inositol monophosphatase family enzyme